QVFSGLDPGLKLHVAIAIELAVVVLGICAPAIGWFFVSGCLAVFVVVLLRLLSMDADSCGCFGTAIKVHPGVMLGIDSACLLAILAAKPWGSLRGAKRAPLVLLLLLVAAGVAAPWLVIDDASDGGLRLPVVHPPTTSASTNAGSLGAPTKAAEPTTASPAKTTTPEPVATATPPVELPRYIVLSPLKQKWVGKHIRDTELARWLDVDAFPQDGEWLLFRYTCDHCKQHFQDLDAAFATNPKTYVLVHIPDDKDQDYKVVDVLPPHFEPIAELPRGTEWVGVTPWTLELEGGIVRRAYLNNGEEEDSAKEAPVAPPVEKQ
ncbi:MAG: hypothetical protein K8S98_16160, partial [Planctomycetes bacterium]|nr:hypothetical protein [Planctomycetota bacterium]